MEKEFEVLEETLKDIAIDLEYDDNPTLRDRYYGLLDVNQALTELKQIKEAKPSEAIEFAKILLEENEKSIEVCVNNNYKCDWIKARRTRFLNLHQALLKAQEQEKENAEYKEVLRIIFEKNIDIDMIKNYQTVIEYNWNIRFDKYKRKELTEEEFDLLTRYIDNENNK